MTFDCDCRGNLLVANNRLTDKAYNLLRRQTKPNIQNWLCKSVATLTTWKWFAKELVFVWWPFCYNSILWRFLITGAKQSMVIITGTHATVLVTATGMAFGIKTVEVALSTTAVLRSFPLLHVVVALATILKRRFYVLGQQCKYCLICCYNLHFDHRTFISYTEGLMVD